MRRARDPRLVAIAATVTPGHVWTGDIFARADLVVRAGPGAPLAIAPTSGGGQCGIWIAWSEDRAVIVWEYP